MMEGSSEIAIRIKGLIEIRMKKPKKDLQFPTTLKISTSAIMYNN